MISALRPATEIITKFEGYHPAPYLDPIGKPTVGYGHLIPPSEFEYFGVRKLGKRYVLDNPEQHALSREEVMMLFGIDIRRFIVGVDDLINVPLTANQYAAVLSFSFNLGLGNLRTSTLRKRINAGDHGDVPYQLSRWVYAGGRKLRGLVRRRKAEAALYQRRSSYGQCN